MNNIPLKSAKRPLLESSGRSGSCLGDTRINLLECINTCNLTSFSDSLVDSIAGKEDFPLQPDHWINSPIESEDGKSLMIIALEKKYSEFVALLLKFGARADHFNESYGLYPIHIPSRNGDLESLKLLFRYLINSADPNSVMRINGRTPLHLMAENNFVEGVEYLLRQKPKVDIKDKKGGQTPLFLAAFKRADSSIIRSLLKYGADPDLKCLGSKTARDLINRNYDIVLDEDNSSPPESSSKQGVSIQRLGEIVEKLGLGQGNYYQLLNEFQYGLIQYKEEEIADYRFPGNMNLVQKICDQNIEDCLKYLFNNFPNMSPDFTSEGLSPVCIAAQRMSRPILQILADKKADFTTMNTHSSETILHILLKEGNKRSHDALKFILNDPEIEQQIRSIMNKKDMLGNTALHLAAQRQDQEVVKRLLQLGANIGMKNIYNEMPVTNILPSTMEEFLNEDCLLSKGDVNHDDFELEFDYSFLAPPYEDLLYGLSPHDDDESMIHIKPSDLKIPYKSALPEMNSLWIMAESKEHRHLLKHPVITSFLWCKWGRIRPYFNRNLRFFMTFVFLTTWFIFENYGGSKIKNEQNYITFCYLVYIVFTGCITGFIFRDLNSDINDMMANMKNGSTGRNCLSVLLSSWFEIGLLIVIYTIVILGEPFLTKALFIILVCLLFRELLNLAVSIKRYILSPENLVQVLLIIFMSVLLFDPRRTEKHESLHRHIAGTTIVLSWASLVTLIGKHPKLMRYNVYVTMFYKVMKTFFYFLIWYALFIIAFGLGFYIILHKENREGEDSYVFFDTPLLSMIKTSTMFVGELEFSDIPIDIDGPYSTFSYGFFISFVFLIVVVLMNLLNGLAVSDTGIIQEKAETVGYVSRVETISYTESVLLGDPFDFLSNWPKIGWIRSIPSISFLRQMYRNKYLQKFFHRVTGATGILLFYSFLPDKKLTIKPNEKLNGCPCFKIHSMDRSIISSAKKIVLSKKFKEQTVELSELSSKVNSIMDLLLKSEERQKLMMDKLNNIENPVDNWSIKN
ncbi:transient receptor potential cation channel subfamily A member 1 homolog [Lepeophtheirus salmonis]|uniref:transient receptor potential cation channel subfamily A member 1 homolog n=1 Tax=Lepeophtheirus salmonis TaxID=72036 RepID=UPI001AE5F140|nr:transient receptor potential cation channel subfamily A member 1 homolog [Lepeophtheirus salmonis]